MIVVSDSSPLIALARIRRLDLLASLFERILIPVEVHHEVTVAGRGLPGAEEVKTTAWIEVRAPRGPAEVSVERACEGLGAGERATILLAKSLAADLTLLDGYRIRKATFCSSSTALIVGATASTLWPASARQLRISASAAVLLRRPC